MHLPHRAFFGVLSKTLVWAVWACIVLLGFGALAVYKVTPGTSGALPADWPAGSSLRREPGRPNVVVAVHLRCPYTRVSLDVLGRLVARSPGSATVRLLVYRSEDAVSGWEREVPPIAGVTRADDPGGREAEAFGLKTSGRLRFSGGITARRGRSATCRGGEPLLVVIRGEPPAVSAASVFGCELGSIAGRSRSQEAGA